LSKEIKYSIDTNRFYTRPENLLLRGIFLGKKGKKDVFQTPGFFNLYIDKEKYVDLGLKLVLIHVIIF